MKKIILIVILVLVLSLFLCADVYIKNVERIKAFELMGRKRGENVEIKEMWLAENKFAQCGKEYSLIIDYDKDKLYLIIHKPKIYYELPAEIDREKLLALMQGFAPKAVEIIKSTKITDAKVNLSGETKKIANWDCHSTEFEMVLMIPAMNMMPKYKMKKWTTKDLSFDYKRYTKAMNEFFVRYILGMLDIDENSKKELEKFGAIEGFQIAAELTINIFGSEINVESQTLEITEKPAPPGTYSVPKDYKKKTIGFPSFPKGKALY